MKNISIIYRYLPVVLTLCLGVGLSTIASVSLGKRERENNQFQFQHETEAISIVLQGGFEQYTQILLTLRDFYRSFDQVNSPQFQSFISRILATYGGVRALGLSSPSLSTIRLIALRSQPSQSNPEKSKFLENKLLKSEIYHSTINSDCRSAFATARDTGQIIATPCLSIIQGLQPLKLTVILPIYKTPKLPKDLHSRRQALNGYIIGVFQLSRIIEESLADIDYGSDFYLYTPNQDKTSQPLGIYQFSQHKLIPISSKEGESEFNSKDFCNQLDVCTRNLHAWEQQWTILFLPNQNHTDFEPMRGAEAMLAIGLLLTVSPFIYLAMLMAWIDREREVGELKLRLFSMASHEFRTPLSTILLSAQLLEESNHNWTKEKKLKNLYRIQSAAKTMNYRLTDMLTLSRAEVGKLEFSPELIDLPSFCCNIIEDVKMSYEAKQHIVFHSENCKHVCIDTKLLAPILSNLLTNAVKYSPDESVINLRINYTNKEVIFEIHDCGIGIKSEDKLKIYEAFYRSGEVESIDGTGLGLAVVKTCVDLHRGQISVDSRVGVGTVFRVILPA